MMKSIPLPMGIFPALLASGLLCCAFLLPQRAVAGTVYRCSGANGTTAFTNKPSSSGNCRKVADYVDPPAAKPAAAAAKTETAALPRNEYRSAPATDASAAIDTSTAATPTSDAAEVHHGAVYRVTHASGITEYTNVRPRGGAYQILFTYMSTCYACRVNSNINWDTTRLNNDAYRDEVASAAVEFGIDAALLRAVIHAESAFNPNAVSLKGAQGLMQLMPGTASDLGVGNPFDAQQNIRGGAHYLSGLLKQFNGDERLAAAGYNAGPQNVQKYNGVPPFDETRVYVERVATLRKRYHDANLPSAAPPVGAAAMPASAPSS